MDVVSSRAVKPLDVLGRRVGGVVPLGGHEPRVLITGQRLQLVELRLDKGFFHPRHNHPEHESTGYVISGRLQMMIDGHEYTLGPGDAWHHRIGVYHWTRALEDTLAVEIHAPPRPEFSREAPG